MEKYSYLYTLEKVTWRQHGGSSLTNPVPLTHKQKK